MPDIPPSDGDRVDPDQRPPSEDAEFVETYDTDDGVVFYDVDNPLAWLEADNVVSLEDRA